MNRYRLHPAATIDLDAIYDYIGQHNQTAADNLIDLLTDKFRFLSQHPLSGEARPQLGPDVRSFTAGRYVIFYRPRADGVEIARVLHSSRDIGTAFSEEPE